MARSVSNVGLGVVLGWGGAEKYRKTVMCVDVGVEVIGVGRMMDYK